MLMPSPRRVFVPVTAVRTDRSLEVLDTTIPTDMETSSPPTAELVFEFRVFRGHVWLRDIAVIAGSAAIAAVKAPRFIEDGERLVAIAL
jgi:hypothetical protein